MKLPVTEKFLLDIYTQFEKIDKAYCLFAPRTTKEFLCPDLYAMKNDFNSQKERRRFSQLVYYLKKNGYIKIKNLDQKKGVILTKKGEEKIFRVKLKISAKKKRKDKKWQMIIFDIPEKKRHLRDLLRSKLYLLEYQMLQQSIWICPYDVTKETETVLRKYSIDKYVKIFLIEEIEI